MSNYDFDQYSKQAAETIDYPDAGNNLYYPALGLCGEAGEVAEKIKKIIRDKNGEVSARDRIELTKELGDVQWYINALCFELRIELEHVAVGNICKLKSRVKRGVIGGSGDNR